MPCNGTGWLGGRSESRNWWGLGKLLRFRFSCFALEDLRDQLRFFFIHGQEIVARRTVLRDCLAGLALVVVVVTAEAAWKVLMA